VDVPGRPPVLRPRPPQMRAAGSSSRRADPVVLNSILRDTTLAKTDRAAMMVSLEARAVFLDNDAVDFCARLPLWLQIPPRRA
jgi:hypothetical protein